MRTGVCSVGFWIGLLGGLPRARGANLCAHDPATPDYLSAFRAHLAGFRAFAVLAMPLELAAEGAWVPLPLGQLVHRNDSYCLA
jgi:hypothetical protein